MQCPRCAVGILDERVRDGITIDVCPECRGVWLDRGELERLLARAAAEDATLMADRSPRRDDDDDDDDDDDRRRREPEYARRDSGGHQSPHRKKRWFESLGEMFD